ncbi:MAG: LPS export ABC transporter permease LptG [Pseudomonadota bacterium]|jgi:Predicted permeases|nr:MAG: LPS export ABC transporter permease LptG [Pseudomonadota bacterium]
MSLIDRYLLRAILGSTALVLAVLLVLGLLFVFLGEQSDIGEGRYTAGAAFWYSVMSLPQQAWEMLPIAALIGSLVGLGALARGSELIVLRASGVSVARMARSALTAAALLIALQVALGEFVAPPLEQAARQQKAFAKYSDVTFGGASGAWVRDGNLILNVAQQSGATQFGGMLVFELSDEHRLSAIGRAARALGDSGGAWRLSGYAESRFATDRVVARRSGTRTLESNLSAGFLGLAVKDPQELETRTLWSLIRFYQANQLDARPYVFAFWSRISRTTAVAFAVLLALPFVLGPLRSAGAGARTLVGLVLGVGLFLLQRLIESGTIIFDVDPIVLAWLPTALLAALSLGLLARTR